MGSSASKQTSRKLAKTIINESSSSIPKINRSGNVNQLPPVRLQQQYEQQQAQSDNDSSFTSSSKPSNTSFDAKGLTSKLKKKHSQQQQQQQVQQPGKDGQDPHFSGTSTYDSNDTTAKDQNFINSITRLGKQIHSTSMTSPVNIQESMALKQLKNRKEIFTLGEQELLLTKDPENLTQQQKQSIAGKKEIIKTMVHPRTLVAILNDLHDSRINSKDSIVLDYQLHPNFVNDLGTRFKVAKTTVIIDDAVKEGEIGHKSAPIIRQKVTETQPPVKPDEGAINKNENQSDNEFGSFQENMDNSRLKKLKHRISLDD